MSVSTFIGFVVIDGEQVLSYDQLRNIGFIGPSAESEYLGGSHGVNGMFQIRPTPKQSDLMDDQGLSIALVHTPWFNDKRLSMEPELVLDVIISEDHGEVLNLEYDEGYTRVVYDYSEDGESVNVRGKLSISAYATAPQSPVNLLADIGWSSAIPAMPSPADVLAQLGSQKSLEEQFAAAFAKPQPAPNPVPTPEPYQPPNFFNEPKPAPQAPKVEAPKPVAAPVNPDDLLQSMFGPLLK